MLQTDKPPEQRPAGAEEAAAGEGPPIGRMAPPKDTVLARLVLRRWLIVHCCAVIVLLSAIYAIPSPATALAMVAIAGGLALIPRAGLKPFSRLTFLDQEPIHRAEQVANALIVAQPEPAILLEEGGTVIAFNSKASDLFGGLRIGAHLSTAIRNPQVLDAVAQSGPNFRVQTVTFAERVPVERHMAATVSRLALEPFRDGPAILVSLRDLTEMHRLDQLRADFIANASHEIRTPLASLLGFIETLQGAARNDADARDRFLAIMAKQGVRMQRLIDNLMSLSRIEMRAHLKPQDPVHIADLAAQACDALEPMAAEANIQVRIAAPAKDAVVLGDRDELLQVFINLLHNAIKYGRSGGHVFVNVERVMDQGAPKVAVSVRDDGPGIPAQHLPRLTERFYRVPDAASMEKGGTGLGLAIVKHVVNRHRAELRISSVEGDGSTFTILFTEAALSAQAIPTHQGAALHRA